MVNATQPWSGRGSNQNIGADDGVFNFSNAHGGVYTHVSFRHSKITDENK